MRAVETLSAAGTGLRRAVNKFYQMIEGLETSPSEILYDRILRLEQEVSALKRNLRMDSIDYE